jgi:predicted regulator of Ras-like GTPase activity (Roadblock/LC7/MglB family)
LVGLPAMEAAQALADLTEISAQIETAVLAERGGAVVASTFSEDDKGEAFAAAAAELVRAAEDSGELSSKELVQVQAASPQGCVFVVRDERHLVAAVTGAQPTVGLVFYDLKTCLRLLEREKTEKKPKTVRRTRVKKEADAGS